VCAPPATTPPPMPGSSCANRRGWSWRTTRTTAVSRGTAATPEAGGVEVSHSRGGPGSCCRRGTGGPRGDWPFVGRKEGRKEGGVARASVGQKDRCGSTPQVNLKLVSDAFQSKSPSSSFLYLQRRRRAAWGASLRLRLRLRQPLLLSSRDGDHPPGSRPSPSLTRAFRLKKRHSFIWSRKWGNR
jgi:hypothetical protein